MDMATIRIEISFFFKQGDIMNDRQLSSFIETAKLGSFSKAASVLFISPAALIQQINLLERDLGFPLFNRTNHGVTLTENGVHFLTSAKK